MGDLAGANATEEDKILAMMSQAGEEFNPANYAKFKPRSGFALGLVKQPPPPNYVCHRCGQKGHWIKFCPTNGDPTFDNPRLKRSSGIPTSHVVPVSSNVKGAMVDRHGNLVMRSVDHSALATDSKKSLSMETDDSVVPPELTCSICKEIVQNAVIIPCCGESFCDECIREYLLENEFVCFACKQDVSPDALVPNKPLRAAAKSFQSRLVQRKRYAVARGLPTIFVSQTEQIVEKPAPPVAITSVATVTSSSSSSTSSHTSDQILVSSSDTKSTTHGSTNSVISSPAVSTINETQITGTSSSGNKQNVNNDKLLHVDEVINKGRTPSPALRTTSPVSMTTTTTNMSVSVSKPVLVTTTTGTAGLSGTVTSSFMPPILPTLPIMTFPQHSLPAGPGMILPGLPLPLPVPAPLPIAIPPALPTGQNALLLQAALNNTQTLDATSMARLTELLAAAERQSQENKSRSGSPPPLSLEEFYRQQKVLRGITKDTKPSSRSRSSSFSSTYSSSSYSSRSRSRSRDPSWNRSPNWSRSRSRSFSRSPARMEHRHSCSPYSSMQQSRGSPFDKREVERPKRKRKDRSGEQYEKESKKPRKGKHRPKQDDLLSPTSSDHLKKHKHRKRRKHEKGHKEKILSSDINNETPAASTQEDNNIEMSTSENANEILAEASSSLDPGKVQSQQTDEHAILEDATSQEAIDIPHQENNGTKKEVSIVPDNLKEPTNEVPKTDEVLSQEEIASGGNSKSREVSPKPHPLINSLHNDSGHKKHKHKHSKSKERRRAKESEPLPITASMVSRVEKSRHKKHKQERHHHHDDKLKRKKSKKCSKTQ